MSNAADNGVPHLHILAGSFAGSAVLEACRAAKAAAGSEETTEAIDRFCATLRQYFDASDALISARESELNRRAPAEFEALEAAFEATVAPFSAAEARLAELIRARGEKAIHHAGVVYIDATPSHPCYDPGDERIIMLPLDGIATLDQLLA